MKLTSRELKEMIEEVIAEVALCRNKTTGHFDDCSPGNVYSLSHKGAKSAGVSSDLVGRGTMTKNRKLDTPYGANTSDTEQCGRMKISGDKKKKDRRCRDYKQKGRYGVDEDSMLLPTDDDSDSQRKAKIFPGYDEIRKLSIGITETPDESDIFVSINDLIDWLNQLRDDSEQVYDILDNGMVAESNQVLMRKCQQIGMRTQQQFFGNLVKSLNTIKLASDGKLNEPVKS
jgi:hypothetical protein